MMKQICLMFCYVFALAMAYGQSSEKKLYVFHTNDTHSRIEPFAEDFQDTVLAGKAGFVRRATFVREMRTRYPHLLLFDSGDFSQGTPYYNMFKGEVEVELMNEMKYDAGTIGNHEFDFGLENMARLFRMARFPIVCANYGVEDTVLDGLVKDYVVLKREGIRIGVFGLGAQLEGLVATENYGGVKFKDPIAEARKVVSVLRKKEHCDVVVCLSHLGWKSGTYCDVKLIEQTRGIDIVLGGHSHSYFKEPRIYKNMDGKPVPLQQMGKNGAFVGKMILEFRKNKIR